MTSSPVIKNCSYCLVHVPDLVQFGSKPRREILQNPAIGESISNSLRTFDQMVCYPPNQVFIGNLSPSELNNIPRPWFERKTECSREGQFGEILDQTSFYGLLKLADVLTPPLFQVDSDGLTKLQYCLAANPLLHTIASRFEIPSANEHKQMC